jgi:hypothetical protein
MLPPATRAVASPAAPPIFHSVRSRFLSTSFSLQRTVEAFHHLTSLLANEEYYKKLAF